MTKRPKDMLFFRFSLTKEIEVLNIVEISMIGLQFDMLVFFKFQRMLRPQPVVAIEKKNCKILRSL